MEPDQALNLLKDLNDFYDSIPLPKNRNVDLDTLKGKLADLQSLKEDLGHDQVYQNLVNGMSQVIATLERFDFLSGRSDDEKSCNYSERGMNKTIPPILKRVGRSLPVEWTDKWGHTCSISNGYWGAKNYRVMDALGYMFLLKHGGDRLPENAEPLFNDLVEIQQRESQLNGCAENVLTGNIKHYIRFDDDHFRQYTGLRMSSTEIKNLLLETSRVEFKLTFPVRCKATGAKENTHLMNYYSRFFELGYEDLIIKSNGIVLKRRYRVVFNTLLGELTVNNLLAKFNDPIDVRLYLLPDSAQIFYRRALSHNNIPVIHYNLDTIASLIGLTDSNLRNLAITFETNILGPLKDSGFIDSYEKVTEHRKIPKYSIRRSST